MLSEHPRCPKVFITTEIMHLTQHFRAKNSRMKLGWQCLYKGNPTSISKGTLILELESKLHASVKFYKNYFSSVSMSSICSQRSLPFFCVARNPGCVSQLQWDKYEYDRVWQAASKLLHFYTILGVIVYLNYSECKYGTNSIGAVEADWRPDQNNQSCRTTRAALSEDMPWFTIWNLLV